MTQTFLISNNLFKDYRPNALQSLKYHFFAGSKDIMNTSSNLERAINQEVDNLKNNSIIPREIIQKPAFNTSQISNLNLLAEKEEVKVKEVKETNEAENTSKSAKSQAKFQANFNVINELFKNFKPNNIAPEESNSNKVNQKNEQESLFIKNDLKESTVESKREKVNDVFINLSKHGQDLLGDVVPKNPPSFFLHEPKVNRTIKKNDFEIRNSALHMERAKKSYSDGDFGRNGFRNDKNDEDDELASILGYFNLTPLKILINFNFPQE